MNTTRTLALVAALALIGGILGLPAAAQNDEASDEAVQRNDTRDPQERRQDMRDRQEERRHEARERSDQRGQDLDARGDADATDRREARSDRGGPGERDGRPDHRPEARQDRLREAYAKRCGDESNETDDRCVKARDVDAPAAKARRAAHALTGAIAATERQIDRLDDVTDRLRGRLADGNATDEDAAAIEQRLDKILVLQDRLDARLLGLQERLERLHAKWEEVREHVAQKRREGRLQETTCQEARDHQLDRLEARHDSALLGAEARRDRALAEENLTDEQKQRAWDAYNGTLAELEASYAAAQERVGAAYEDCVAEGAGDTGSDDVAVGDGAGDGSTDAGDGSGDGPADGDDASADGAGDGSDDGADDGSGDGADGTSDDTGA